MEFKKLKIADLRPAAYNPRKALKPGDSEYEKIKNSIAEFGYVEPVIRYILPMKGSGLQIAEREWESKEFFLN